MEIPTERQTVSDVQRTDTFQNEVSISMPARLRRMSPERRRAVQRAGAFVLSFTELLNIMFDLHRQGGNRQQLPTLKWVPEARAWRFI